MLLRKNRKHWTKCALRRNFVTLCKIPCCTCIRSVARMNTSRLFCRSIGAPATHSTTSRAQYRNDVRRLFHRQARHAGVCPARLVSSRVPRHARRVPLSVSPTRARVWTPPSASLTAIPPAPAVVPAGDAPVRVPGQHLHAEGRRRAREGGHHRAEYVPSHRLETHRDRRASFSAIDRVIGFWCPPKRRDTVWLFSLAKTETRVRAFSRDKRRKR